MKPTKFISKEAELRFASKFSKKRYDIFFPYGEDGPVDLLIHKNHKFLKIQVKATKPKNGSISCKLRSTNNWQSKKYTKEEIDYFGIYDYENKKGYLIPIIDVENMSEIQLRIIPARNNQKKKIRPATKYLFFE